MNLAFSGRHPWSQGITLAELDRDNPVPKLLTAFVCPHGHDLQIPFAPDAELPDAWDCRLHGARSPRRGAKATSPSRSAPGGKSHWDHLCERRTEEELKEILAEALRRCANERGEPGITSADTGRRAASV